MRKWLRRVGIAVLVLGLAFGALYEASTNAVRGWLRGEAFYDGRPTSYWAGQIDGWVARFDSLAHAEGYLRSTSIISSSDHPIPPPPTWWGRLCIALHVPALRTDAEIPGILSADPRAEEVWRELEATDAYGGLIRQARRESGFWGAFRRVD